MRRPQWFDADAVRRAVPPDRARRLVRQVLADGFDPASDPARLSPRVPAGQLLVMPSALDRSVGVKVLSVAPGNPAVGRERIQALYVLMDPDTLTPSVLLDGTAVTALRTPAVSAVALDSLAPQEVSSVVVFGSGPQAVGHLEALVQIRSPRELTVVARDAERCRATAHRAAALGIPRTQALVAGDPRVEDAVRGAQAVVAATSSATPVLDGAWVADGACVVAIGSHEPDRRELDGPLLGRSLVVVEDAATALREAGDVVLAVREGHLAEDAPHGLADLVAGRVVRAADRPNVFKSVGMAWQDLAVAAGVTRLIP